MKSQALPSWAVWAILAVVAVVIAIFAYTTFFKSTPQVDANSLSPQRLQDPDPRGG
ncbi:MAG TPA: hypothetical protein VM328_11095 [Fimbriimonadaceae bacterium]|nr:hypothetical protein [Fimbriimonadaceae bacterium]